MTMPQNSAKINEKNNKRVELRGSTWRMIYPVLQDDGTTRQVWKGGFETEAEARAARCAKVEEYQKQKGNVYVEDRTITLRNYLTNWFEYLFVPDVRSSTHMVFRYTLEDYIIPNLDPTLLLIDVTRQDIETLFRQIGNQMPSHAKKAKELLSICFNTAVMDKLIQHNPCVGAKVPRYKKKKITILSREQLASLLKHAYQTDSYLEIMLGLKLGLRKGEVYGLKFSDIDYQNRTVHIQRQCTYEYQEVEVRGVVKRKSLPVEAPLKTDGSERVLHVSDSILFEIHRRAEKVRANKAKYNKLYEDNDYICGRKDGRPRAGSCLNGALSRITEKMGIPPISFHSLRHTMATVMIENKVELPTISKILGHASVETTFKYYCDIMDGNEQMMQMMEDTFGHLYTDRYVEEVV